MNSAGFNLGVQNTSKGSTVTNILFYTLIIAFIAIIILVIMHFTYKPIFGPGSVLSGDTGTVYWEDEAAAHPDVSSNCPNKYYNFSICFDIIVDNTFTSAFTNKDILLHTNNTGANNVRFFLDASKNDLTFEVITKDKDSNGNDIFPPSSIVFTNVPVRKEFTIGFVLVDKFMEAYINGSLYKTQTFAPAVLKPNDSDSLVFKDVAKLNESTGVRIKRLRFWNNVVGPDVMRAYGASVSPSFSPKYDTSPDTTTCSG
jgi:hypothetical protein